MAVIFGAASDYTLGIYGNANMDARTPEEMKAAVYGLQDYYAKELPDIALYWRKSIYPYRSDRFEGWMPLQGYGLTGHQSWFSVKPVAG